MQLHQCRINREASDTGHPEQQGTWLPVVWTSWLVAQVCMKGLDMNWLPRQPAHTEPHRDSGNAPYHGRHVLLVRSSQLPGATIHRSNVHALHHNATATHALVWCSSTSLGRALVLPGSPAHRALLFRAGSQPALDALQVECVAARTPHHGAVVARVLPLGRAAIKRRPAYPTYVIASIPRPRCHSVPLLDLHLERHRRHYFSLSILVCIAQERSCGLFGGAAGASARGHTATPRRVLSVLQMPKHRGAQRM